MKIGPIGSVTHELRISVEIGFTPEELVLGWQRLQEMVDRGAECREPAIRRVLAAIQELAYAGRGLSPVARRPLDPAIVGCPGMEPPRPRPINGTPIRPPKKKPHLRIAK